MASGYEREREVAIEAVRRASAVCSYIQSKIEFDAIEKADQSPVTIADFASQAVVCKMISDAFPDDPIIGEEDADELRLPENQSYFKPINEALRTVNIDTNHEELYDWIDRGGSNEYSQRFWTLDPIDGTKGFVRNDQYAVSLALIVDGQPQVAVLGCPNLPTVPDQPLPAGMLFVAVRGEGSFSVPLNSVESEPTRLQVEPIRSPSEARICESFESKHTSHSISGRVIEKLNMSRPPLRIDSQAKYATVARAETDIYIRFPVYKDYREKIWDHAAGVLVVTEAGGRVSDVFGEPLDWTCGSQLKNNRGVLVTNGLLHDAVLKALEQSWTEAGLQA